MIRKVLDPRVLASIAALGGIIIGVVAYRWLSDSSKTAVALQEGFDAAAFDAFPLVSVGSSFEGLNQTRAVYRRISPNAGIASSANVTFIYGDCSIPESESACAPPLQVTVLPACTPDIPEWMKVRLRMYGALRCNIMVRQGTFSLI